MSDATVNTAADFDRVVRRAAWIGQRPGEAPTASFTSLFLAFLTEPVPFSRWLAANAAEIGPAIETILSRWAVNVGNPSDRRSPGEGVAIDELQGEEGMAVVHAVVKKADDTGIWSNRRSKSSRRARASCRADDARRTLRATSDLVSWSSAHQTSPDPPVPMRLSRW